MANTSNTYVGDGATSIFALTFPYLDQDHVQVVLNNRVLLASEWKWVTTSSIQIIDVDGSPRPPGINDAIVVKRATPITGRLVDFQPGSVLTEANLDLDSNQLFYLIQENQENLTKLIDDAMTRIATENGITDLDGSGVMDELVAGVLADETAANIQQRITDIDTNASAITVLNSFKDDVGARYGVSLNVGGYITGFLQHNDGQSGTFDILTDKFRVVDPASGGQNPKLVFAIQDGDVWLQNLKVGQSIMVGGHIGGVLNRDPGFMDIGTYGSWYTDFAETSPLADDVNVTHTPHPVSGGPSGGSKITYTDNDNTLETIFSEKIHLDPNKTYRVSGWVRQTVGDRVNYLMCAFGTDAGLNITPSTETGWTGTGTYFYWDVSGAAFPGSWTRHEFTFGPLGTADMPTTARTVQIGALVCGSGTTSTTVELMDFRVEEVLPGTLIQDDAITTAKIAANAVTANEINANAVTAAKISVTNLAAINADMGSITAGDIVLPSGGFIRSGQTAFDTGTGFYLGNDSGTPKFSIGNASGNRLTWDGTTLSVFGDLITQSSFRYNDSGTRVAYEDTAENHTGIGVYPGNWTAIRTWKMRGTGSMTVKIQGEGWDGSPTKTREFMYMRIKRNSTIVGSEQSWGAAVNTRTYSNISWTDPDDVFTIEMAGADIDGGTLKNRIIDFECLADFDYGHSYTT